MSALWIPSYAGHELRVLGSLQSGPMEYATPCSSQNYASSDGRSFGIHTEHVCPMSIPTTISGLCLSSMLWYLKYVNAVEWKQLCSSAAVRRAVRRDQRLTLSASRALFTALRFPYTDRQFGGTSDRRALTSIWARSSCATEALHGCDDTSSGQLLGSLVRHACMGFITRSLALAHLDASASLRMQAQG